MPTIQQRHRDVAGQWRVCDNCRCNVPRLGSLCRRCRRRRGRFGTVKPHLRLDRGEWNDGQKGSPFDLASRYVEAHPPAPDVVEGLHNVLSPGNTLPRAKARPSNPAYVVRQEMVWQADPRSAKRMDTHGRLYRYTDQERLTVLLAVSFWIEEREGAGFPHDSAEVTLASALLNMRKRPRGPAGRTGARRSRPIPPTALHAVAGRIRRASALSLYLLTGARHLVAQRREVLRTTRAPVRKVTVLPPPRIIEPDNKPRTPWWLAYVDKIEK